MKSVLLVGMGGFVGANLRVLVCDSAVKRWGDAFPFGTLLVNVFGSFLIGLLVMLLADRFAEDPELKKLIITGFLGAFTTFSSYMLEVVQLITGQAHSQQGWLYLAISIMLGLCAVLLGTWVGTQLIPAKTAQISVT